MLNKLLEKKKITLKEFNIYSVFAMNTSGLSLLNIYKDELFNVMVEDINSLGSLAFVEGTRNIVREIEFTINSVNELLKKEE